MVIHKEYALRRFCDVPLKHRSGKDLLERMWGDPYFLKKVVFVTVRDCLPNTMLISQQGAEEAAFLLQLSEAESESLILVNDGLLKEKKKVRRISIEDPFEAWEALQDFNGLLHVQLAFKGQAPDWYEEIAVPNEALPPSGSAPGFASFIREQVDLVLCGITLKEQIDLALRTRDERLFIKSVRLYKQVCRSCFWQL